MFIFGAVNAQIGVPLFAPTFSGALDCVLHAWTKVLQTFELFLQTQTFNLIVKSFAIHEAKLVANVVTLLPLNLGLLVGQCSVFDVGPEIVPVLNRRCLEHATLALAHDKVHRGLADAALLIARVLLVLLAFLLHLHLPRLRVNIEFANLFES